MTEYVNKSIHIHKNLIFLRKSCDLTIEEFAEKLDVSRQTVAKWEKGTTVPDIIKCDAIAAFYNITIDDLLHYDGETSVMPIAPRGKYFFGTVTIDEKGQIIIPQKAREIFSLKTASQLVVLGDETQGIALVTDDTFMDSMQDLLDHFYPK
ncbi:MAG: helix-turn-helix domain-containing protein [Tetragenococcus halophilus]|uniref:Putative Xre family DNA-binding protein n=1 Tax=Tetragenococcus halophilus subsp. halophilus TaxID=1513897 RepID=A0A2H6CTS6_TETHA|nr:helix-turn-helix domain-containing protein [Tetragenococcus halophilus]MCF1602855.1 helix-turn-helix domain-containing protein [Tetragenococcus halophilus]MCF1675243.1 helix-turn-helix domain-containing protein [Tetragenococcus halophilus]MCO7027184.1 helix-turn-helix domain-containing protein [Tetragenococcus halophilus]MCO8287122.1 helix-turn-helix domain-containing protein [Tetragenococcus halophilus]MCO8289617.1 helix-turn-helix domain-containing protein [Tetragenococcus halophilus]